MNITRLPIAFLIGMTSISTSSYASDINVYSKVGLPGLTLGAGYNVNEYIGVRADYATLGSIKREFEEDEISYNAKLKNDKFNLMLDLYPFKGGFRLTSGLGMISTKLNANGHSRLASKQEFKLGDKKYEINISSDDQVSAQIKYPSVSPYLGIGYGHNIKQTNGEWGFLFDVGVYFGKPKTQLSLSNSLNDKLAEAEKRAGNISTKEAQENIDYHLNKAREDLSSSVGKLKVLPALSLGISYHF